MDIEEMKEARNKAVVAYVRFCQDSKYYNTHLFCFCEGEDYKYYYQRILHYADVAGDKVINYNCGGKNEVIKAHKLIVDSRKYDKVYKMFFIDRDFEDRTSTQYEDIYVTPGYSIENFYTSCDAFSRILVSEFGINITDTDHELCMSNYKIRLEEFSNVIILLNAWVMHQRKLEAEKKCYEVKPKIEDFKLSKIFKTINIDKLETKCDITLEYIYSNFSVVEKIEEQKIYETVTQMKMLDSGQVIRGKYLMKFMLDIISDLKIKNRDGRFLTTKRNSVSIGIDNPIGSLSQYADTTECLKEYLQKNKKCVN